jgi:ABC-type multidrug transport system fused ATPase/permease subunit
MSARSADFLKKPGLSSWVKYLLPSQADMLFIAIFVGVVALGPRLMNMDGDLGRHLTIGGYILDEMKIPTSDIFSHTMDGMHLTPHEWLAQVLFALVYRVAGLDGVVILCAFVLAATFTIVFHQAYERGKLILAALGITILAAGAASVHWLARPHIFTLLFAVLWVGELEKWRQGKSWRWWSLPLIMLVWVNTHGAFIIGILIWIIYLVGSLQPWWKKSAIASYSPLGSDLSWKYSQESRLFLLGFPILITTFINPAGWRVWATTFGFLQNQYLVSHTVEYQSPDFQTASFWPFLAMICLSVLLAALNRRRVSWVSVMLLVAWTAFSLVSARNIAIYAVLAAPILSEIIAMVIADNRIFNRLLAFDTRLQSVDVNLPGSIWPAVLSILIAWLVILNAGVADGAARNRFSEQVFPVEAVNWMESHPSTEPVFNYFPWGGYLLYRNWPSQRVFIDGQTDFYGEALTRQYEEVITLAEGWQDVFAQYQVGRVIMPSESLLVAKLPQVDGWQVVYLDNTAAILDFRP